jgi:hypothetical protein
VAVDHTMTWQRIVLLIGQVWQMWVNDCLTSVTIVGELNGATWPSHGLPRGTLSLVCCFKKVVDSIGFNPTTSGRGGTSWARSGYQPA